MKTTEELAKEHGLVRYYLENDGTYSRSGTSIEKLEAFRKACIEDYFERAEPAGHLKFITNSHVELVRDPTKRFYLEGASPVIASYPTVPFYIYTKPKEAKCLN